VPFALLIIGLILVITGANNTYSQFGTLLTGDFTGPNNFLYWILAFGALGALGYSDMLRPFARGFMVLIFIVIIVKNGGLFQKFGQAISAGTGTTSSPSTTALTSGVAALSSAETALETTFTVAAAAV